MSDAPEPRTVIVYVDATEFDGGPPVDGERVMLVRGDGPCIGHVLSWATVRRHDDGVMHQHVDSWPDVEWPLGHRTDVYDS